MIFHLGSTRLFSASFAMDGFSEFVRQHDMWLLIGGLVVIFGAFGILQYRGHVRRRRIFEQRIDIGENEWFESYYPVPPGQRAMVRGVLSAIAQDIGVPWTRLRPNDRFEEVLRIPGKYSPQEDLEGADLDLAVQADALGIPRDELPGFSGSLKDFLDSWIHLSGGAPQGESTGTATSC